MLTHTPPISKIGGSDSSPTLSEEVGRCLSSGSSLQYRTLTNYTHSFPPYPCIGLSNNIKQRY